MTDEEFLDGIGIAREGKYLLGAVEGKVARFLD